MAHIYDYAIIGSGLTGLSIAAALSRETSNIALIEAADFPHGANKKIQFPTGPMNNGLRFVPDSVMAEKAMSFLQALISESPIREISEVAPITYDSGQFKTFLGFGENPPEFYEELQYFTSAKRIELDIEPHEWTEKLFAHFKGDFLPRSYVTKFQQDGERVSHVTINGSKTLHAQNFIFTGSVKDLALLLPEEAMSIRVRNKVAKNIYWTALCLDLCHSKAVTDSEAIHVLNGTTQDEIGPCAGRFQPAVTTEQGTLQSSQWLTFIASESTEDSEVVGTALKKIKRQVKRAYPESLDNLKLERIYVAPLVAGTGDIKLSANQTWPSLENLWIGSATMNDQKNLLGSLLQAEMILASLGFKVSDKESSTTELTEETSEAAL